MTDDTKPGTADARAREVFAQVLRDMAPRGEYVARTFLSNPSDGDNRTIEAMLRFAAEVAHPVSADAERESEAVWRCAIADAVGALDVLKRRWEISRRKADREAGAILGTVLDLVWGARSPAAKDYRSAAENGKLMIDRVRAALQHSEATNVG